MRLLNTVKPKFLFYALSRLYPEKLIALIKEAKEADTNNVIASGERSVAIGGDVNSSNINTGSITNIKS